MTLLESCGYRDESHRYDLIVLPPAHVYGISKASSSVPVMCIPGGRSSLALMAAFSLTHADPVGGTVPLFSSYPINPFFFLFLCLESLVVSGDLSYLVQHSLLK